MLKKIVLAVAVTVCFVSVSIAGTIQWGYSGDLGVSYTAGWLVELIEDVAKDGVTVGTMYDDHTMTGGDSFISTPITTTLVNNKAGTFWGTSFGSPGASLELGDNIYTVIYNASTFAAATQYQVVDASPYVLPASDVNATYSQGNPPAGTWAPIVPVPEPGTIMLFALGLVTLVARRKRR
jgi:hypothetical protein